MKKYVLISTLIVLCFASHGQTKKTDVGKSAATSTTTFAKGDNVLGFSVGLGGNLYSGVYGSGVKRIPALLLGYERCVKDRLFDEKSSLGIGGVLGYASASYSAGGYGWKSSNIIVGARGALHYQLINRFDTYSGLMLGYNIASWKWTGDWGGLGYSGSSAGGFAWSWFVGGRYYFNDKFAATAELGFGVSILNLGVAMKF